MMILPDIQESKKPVPQDNTSEISERVWKNRLQRPGEQTASTPVFQLE